jgi:hypothetical protein
VTPSAQAEQQPVAARRDLEGLFRELLGRGHGGAVCLHHLLEPRDQHPGIVEHRLVGDEAEVGQQDVPAGVDVVDGVPDRDDCAAIPGRQALRERDGHAGCAGPTRSRDRHERRDGRAELPLRCEVLEHGGAHRGGGGGEDLEELVTRERRREHGGGAERPPVAIPSTVDHQDGGADR